MRIVITTGAAAGREFEISRQMIVGRSASSDVHLPDAGVSSRHASLRPIPGGIEVLDLGSSNGTFVNGSELHSARAVYRGDELRFSRVSVAVQDSLVVDVASGRQRYDAPAPDPVAPAGNGSKRQTQLIAAGIIAVVLVASAFVLGRGFGGDDDPIASASATSPAHQTATPAPPATQPPATTQPPAPTQPPVPTQPPSPRGNAQATLRALGAGTASLPAGDAQPSAEDLVSAEIAARAVGSLGVGFRTTDGGENGAFWTVFGSAADAQSYYKSLNYPTISSGDPNVQLSCATGTRDSGAPVSLCYGLRAGSLVIVGGYTHPPITAVTADRNVASAYAKAGLDYAASIER